MAASLPGAELFPEICFFEETTCPGQLRCLGQNFFSNNGLSGILRFLCAEQEDGNPKQWTVRNSGTPVRRTKRQKYQKMHFQKFWDSCAQNKTSEIPKMDFQEFWDSQDVGNLKKMHFQEFRDSCAPPRPPKKRSAPLAAVVGLFSLDRVTRPWRLHPTHTTLSPRHDP